MGDVFIEVLVKRNRKATDTLMKTLLIAFVVVLFAGGILLSSEWSSGSLFFPGSTWNMSTAS